MKDMKRIFYRHGIISLSYLSFFIADKKEKVREELRKIHGAIRSMEEFQDLTFVEDKVLNGFNWNQNFGGSECWLSCI